jgi:hypothetical protein
VTLAELGRVREALHKRISLILVFDYPAYEKGRKTKATGKIKAQEKEKQNRSNARKAKDKNQK